MATSKRPIVPRNFFLNEFHELSPVEKLGGGRAANYLGVSWAAKSKQIHDSLDDVADKISSSHDPLKDARYFVLAQPVAEVEKASKDKKKAPGGSFKEKTAYGGIHGRVFDRLGLDLLQVTDDGSAIVHAESEKFDQLRQRSASLDRLGSREQARWVTIESFSTVPLELRVDADWLRLLKPDESSDVIIELQPVLTRMEADTVLRAIADILAEGGKGQKLTGTGTDFSGRHWFRGKATQRAVRRLAKDFFSVQSIHSPLYSIAAGKSGPKTGRPASAPIAPRAPIDVAALPCVAVIDLGIPADHARLKPFRRGQFTPQDAPRAAIGDHGSFVASRVVFGEHADREQLAEAAGQCSFYDAMIGEYPALSGTTDRVNDKLVMPALDGVRGAAPDVRVFNLSIGDTRSLDSFPVVERTNKRLSLQDLDNFIFANDKLVVVAAGNSEKGVAPNFDYPGHHDDQRWALGSWACGYNTLVCGAFVPRLSAHGLVQNVGWPSPFTRIGPGLCGAPIPSFSAEGGNTNDAYGFTQGLGVWGVSATGLLEDKIGTSHAAPILAREAAFTLQKLQEVCEPGSQPFAVTARAFLTLTAEPPVADQQVQALVERTLGCGKADSRRLDHPTGGSAVLLWQGFIESPDDKVRVQIPIPLDWLTSAEAPVLRIVVCYDPPVSETAIATWACRKVSPVLHLGPDAPSVRAPGGSHASYPVIQRQYDLGKFKPGNETPARDNAWLLELAYTQIAPYPPGMDFDPRQRVAVAAELVDLGESPVDPQPAMQALPIAPTMNRLSTQRVPIRSPIIVKTRVQYRSFGEHRNIVPTEMKVTSVNEAQLDILKQQLADVFVPHLPPLLDATKPVDHMAAKNVSRAFPAFSIQKLLKLDAVTAAKAVVDDYEDNGLDAIHYHQTSKKLFLVQGKLKATDPFGQEEAQAFVAGARDLVNQRYNRFNKNVQDRQAELEVALDEATEIILVVAHTSEAVSEHAKGVLDRFLTDPDLPDERLQSSWIDFAPAQVLEELLAEQAVAPVDDYLVIYGEKRLDTPRVTYYGQVSLVDLVDLYTRYGNRLLEKNIRYFLGINTSDVNKAIHRTLETRPEDFFYLSNGVTAIANIIDPKASKDGGRRFKVNGLSVINGAQTVASCHHFVTTHPGLDVSSARVLLTLIQVDADSSFSADVTRARNHQNRVSLTHFAALDNVQERLRRELAFHKIIYRYRPEARDTTPGLDVMSIDEASIALALSHPDPTFPVTLKREPSRFLNPQSTEYEKLFNHDLAGRRLANAVRLFRRASGVLAVNEIVATGQEKLIYRHGRYVIIWLTLRANAAWLDRADVMSDADAARLLSVPLDAWREKVHSEAAAELAAAFKGPLAFFRNLTNTRPFVVKLRDAGV